MMRVVREPVEFETPIGEAEEFKMGDVINDDAPLEGAYGLNYFFFFQAEDGIRDKLVTEVQTCALPISRDAPGTDVLEVGQHHLRLLLGMRAHPVLADCGDRRLHELVHFDPPLEQDERLDPVP